MSSLPYEQTAAQVAEAELEALSADHEWFYNLPDDMQRKIGQWAAHIAHTAIELGMVLAPVEAEFSRNQYIREIQIFNAGVAGAIQLRNEGDK